MSSYHLIGREWPASKNICFHCNNTAPLRTQREAIASALGVAHDASTLFLFKCDYDHSPLAHLDDDKSLSEQAVQPGDYLYVGVSAEESSTPKAQCVARDHPRRCSLTRSQGSSTPPSSSSMPAAGAHQTRPHAMTVVPPMTAASVATPSAMVNPTSTTTTTAHPVKKLRFADEADVAEDEDADKAEPTNTNATPDAEKMSTVLPSGAVSALQDASAATTRSALKTNSSFAMSSNASDAARSPRVHVDPSPPVVIEADPQFATLLPSAASSVPQASETSSAVAEVLADVGSDGLPADTRDAARPLLVRLANAMLARKPDDVEVWLVDYICNEQLSSDNVTTNLIASRPSHVDGLAETQERSTDRDDDEAAAAADAVAEEAAGGSAVGRGGCGTASRKATTSEDQRSVSGATSGRGCASSTEASSPGKDSLSTGASASALSFTPVGNTVAERLAFGTPAGVARAVVMKLAKLVLDVKAEDPEEFLCVRLASRNFGEEAAMNTLLARTADADTLLAVEDPTIASLLKEIPVDSPGFSVAANLLPSLFSRKPENPVNYMFDHLSGRARSSYAASMRSSMKLAPGNVINSFMGSIESCTSRDEDLDDVDMVNDDDEDEDPLAPPLMAGPSGQAGRGRVSSTVSHFLHALQRRNSVDALRAAYGETSEGSPASPASLHVHPSESVSLPALGARRVSIAPGEKSRGSTAGSAHVMRSGSAVSSHRAHKTASFHIGPDGSPCSTPTAAHRGEMYPVTDRHGSHSRQTNASPLNEAEGQPTRSRGQRVNLDWSPALAAASLLSPGQLQETLEEYAQQLAQLELRVQRIQIDLAGRRRAREYQEKMLLNNDAERDSTSGSATQAATAALKRACAAEKETARYIDALKEQQQALLVLMDVIASNASVGGGGGGGSGGGVASGRASTSQRLDGLTGGWTRASSAPQQEDDVARRLEWLSMEQQHMRSMLEAVFVRQPSLGRF